MRRFLLLFLFYEKILLVTFFREGISIEPAEPPFGFVTPACIFRGLKLTVKYNLTSSNSSNMIAVGVLRRNSGCP